MFHTNLTGAYHRDLKAQHTVLSLPEGAKLWLEAEPTNKYDSQAIKVWSIPEDGPRDDEHFIGYIPAIDCEDVHPYLESHEPFEVRVSELGGLKPKLNIGFDFEFEDGEATEGEALADNSDGEG